MRRNMIAETLLGKAEERKTSTETSGKDNVAGKIPEYSITSFGIDYDVEGIVRRLRSKAIGFPGFQRGFVWDIKRASRFIESLFIRLPVPGIFLYREPESQQQIIIDGQQRLLSLLSYYDGIFDGKEFALTGLKSRFNDLKYGELSSADKLRLDDSVIHATIMRQDKPDDGGSSQIEIFERLNTNATPLSAQEIRAAVYSGEFKDLLDELNSFAPWRELYGKIHKRGRDEELILRFLALFYRAKYVPPMKRFLDEFMNTNRNLEAYPKNEILGVFQQTVETIYNRIGDRAFKPRKAVNAAVFDSLMVGIARRLETGGGIQTDIQRSYDNLLRNKAFERATSSGTSQSNNVHRRIQIATEAFADVE